MKLYQIRLSDATVARVNAGASREDVPEYRAYMDATMLGKLVDRSFYRHVADLATDDLDEAFQIGNVGPEAKITRRERMHSVSVGDVLVKSNGDAFVVASFGFDALTFEESRRFFWG